MDMNSITVALLSTWMGFAVALQVRTQMMADADITTAHNIGVRHVVARIIYFILGIAGMLGLAGLIGSVQAFRSATFPLSFVIGVIAFIATTKLAPDRRQQ